MEEAFLDVQRSHGTERVALTGALATLGRAVENAVCFPDDSSVSRRHAVLTLVADGWSLRDTGSVNGTYVNGQKLAAERLLQPGDRVTVGKSAFVFGSGTTATPEPPPVTAPVEEHRPPRQGHGQVIGVARGVQKRRGSGGREDLVFEVDPHDPYDPAGNRLPPVRVQLSPYRGGHLEDGEAVEVTGEWVGGALRPSTLLNLSAESDIPTRRRWEYVILAVLIALFLFIVLVGIWFVGL